MSIACLHQGPGLARFAGRLAALALCALLFVGCEGGRSLASDAVPHAAPRSGYAPGYLWQSARGHVSIWWSARSIEAVLADPSTAASVKQQLDLARRIRRFASDLLGLPDNGSFTRYAQLDRPFVVWNVQAAPELSLDPVRWCFPVAGCVAYRGYYRREDAEAFADRLRAEGLDVQVAGVTAYSTLGWFDDLLLSTFISQPEPELAQLIFHELAHQVVWVPGDTRFNESFATAVELIGVERWLQSTHADPQVRAAWLGRRERREQVIALLASASARLRSLYQSASSADDQRAGKARVMTDLRAEFAALRARHPTLAAWDRWFAQPLGNAHLMSVGLYHDLVPAFLALYRAQQQDLPRFYEAARALGSLAPDQRAARLAALARME
ncbi:MAG: aminopeptidase [Betaproteobacteria bacterium]